MCRVKDILDDLLLKLYKKEAHVVMLPGYYCQQNECCVIYCHDGVHYVIHREAAPNLVLTTIGVSAFGTVKKVTIDQEDHVKKFMDNLQEVSFLPVHENTEAAWELLKSVNLYKKVTKSSDYAARDWAVTIIDRRNIAIFQLIGSPVRDTFGVSKNSGGLLDLWYHGLRYDTSFKYDDVLSFFRKSEKLTQTWKETRSYHDAHPTNQ